MSASGTPFALIWRDLGQEAPIGLLLRGSEVFNRESASYEEKKSDLCFFYRDLRKTCSDFENSRRFVDRVLKRLFLLKIGGAI